MQNLEIIKKIIKEFFKKTSFEVVLESLSERDKTIIVSLKVEEPQLLIGESGQTLSEIQYLLKIILKKQIAAKSEPRPEGRAASQREASLVPEGREEHFYLDIDINDYKKKKTEYLKETACLAADEVSLIKKEKELAPMPAYERRIVHLALIERQDIITESIGQGAERRVVVKPRT